MDEETFVPNTMRAVYHDTTPTPQAPSEPDGPMSQRGMVLDTGFPTPRPSPTQYLIHVQTAAFSHDELRLARALNPSQTAPQIPLHNFCGTVIDTPVEDHWNSEGPRFKIGDIVFGLASYARDGAAADYLVATEDELAHKPPNVTAAEAATLPLPALTAWQALFSYAGLDANKTGSWPDLRVLVTNAKDNAVGLQALQLLRAEGLFPHTRPWICAMCVCADHEGFLRKEAKADGTIIAPLPVEPGFDLGATFRENQWAPVDIVLDCAGGETFAQAHSPSVVKESGSVLSAVDAAPAHGLMMGNGGGGERRKGRFVAVRPDGGALRRIARLVEANSVLGHFESVVDMVHGAELLAGDAAAAAGGRRGGMMVVRVNQPQ
jgi:NADPH:quinone reductase-like Zn-dependent oxidoreductase